MENLTKINEHIHRLTMPYKDIFTTVYTVQTPNGAILFDAASFDEDVDNYIVPLLKEVGIAPEELKYVFISHNHKDHAGGLSRLMQVFPNVCIVSRNPKLQEEYASYRILAPEDGDTLMDLFRVVSIPGHTADAMALLDSRTMTMISGDCLQLYGIFGSQDWGSNIGLPAEHLEAVEKVRTLGIEAIYTAHDYHPYGFKACGKEAVGKMLDACVTPLRNLQNIVLQNPQMGDEELREIYNTSDKVPPISVRVVAAMRKAINEGKIR